MRRVLLALIAAALLVASPASGQCGPAGCYLPPRPATPPTASVSAEVRSSLPAVVRVIHRDAAGASIGSGVLIATDQRASHVLTCAHLFEGPGQTRVEIAGRPTPARVVAIDRRHDLALLATTLSETRPAQVRPDDPRGVLTACGFGSTGTLRCVRGAVVGLATAVGAAAPSLRIRGAVRSGDSGGPVFDEQGRVVAVVWGARDGETFAMGGGPLRRLLERLSPSNAPRRLTPIPRHPATHQPPAPRGSQPSAEADGQRPDGEAAIQERPVSQHESPSAAADGWARGMVNAKELLAAIAVGGPLGIALWTARRWFRGRPDKPDKQQAINTTRPVAVDSPPPPQQVVPETHYVSYERDEFAKAHQWACEQLARKFPGSVELLTSLDSLIRQQLNGR